MNFLKILFIYLRERGRAQAGGGAEGEADSPLSREPWEPAGAWPGAGWIPGPWDQDPSQKMDLANWATQVPPKKWNIYKISKGKEKRPQSKPNQSSRDEIIKT